MDTGLMQGLAEGLHQGLDSYNQAKKYNEEKSMKDRLYKLQLLKAGVQEDPTGGLIPRQGSAQLGEAMRGAAVQNYKMANPNATDQDLESAVPHGLMPEQYKQIGDMVKPALTYQGQNARAKSYSDIGHERNQIAGASLGLREKNSANAINKQVVSDPVVKATDMQQNSISKGIQQLESKDKPITNQMLNEIQADYANALTGGRQAAQGTIHDQQMQTLQAKTANLKQYITGAPEQAATPQQIAYFKTAFNELRGLNKQIRESSVNSLTGGAQAAYGDKGAFGNVIGNLKQNASGQGLIPQAAPQVSPEDQQAIDWAKANAKDPRAQQILKMHGM